jgi:hypothetical protein
MALPKYPAMPPGFIVNNGRRPFIDESGRDTLGAAGLDDSFGLPMLEMLLSPLLDVVSTSYKESTLDAGGFTVGSFSEGDRLSVVRTISKNPSITKKSPEVILVVRTR